MSRHRERDGVVLVLLAAAGFGAMAIFAKLAYRAGFDVSSLLLVRFALASAVLWAVVAFRGVVRPTSRVLVIAVGLGAVGYAAQASLFFASLERMDASLTSLLLYTYPALVFLGALALRRETATRRRVGALALASGGTILVLAGGGPGALDPLGVAFALGAAFTYTGYILIADREAAGVDPIFLTAVILTAAAASIGAFAFATGGPQLGDIEPGGWAALAGVTVISTVLPNVAFLAGLERVGPSTASIVSTAEPVVTVGLAMLVFGEQLSPVQAVGGLFVVAAVALLNAGLVRRRSVEALA